MLWEKDNANHEEKFKESLFKSKIFCDTTDARIKKNKIRTEREFIYPFKFYNGEGNFPFDDACKTNRGKRHE